MGNGIFIDFPKTPKSCGAVQLNPPDRTKSVQQN